MDQAGARTGAFEGHQEDLIDYLREENQDLRVQEYVGHRHRERNHQGLDNQLLDPSPSASKRGR